jgi:hypothetical protein
MLNTLFAGFSPLIDGNNTKVKDGIDSSVAASIRAYTGATIVQTGFFTPTQNGDHTFNISSANGSFLSIHGVSLINSYSNSTVQSNTITGLVAGKQYAFVYAAPVGGHVNNTINSISFSVGGGANQSIQKTQLSVPTDIATNPLFNPSLVLSHLNGSITPAHVNPIANVLPTNIMANTKIASVPFPAIIPATTNNHANSAYNPIPWETATYTGNAPMGIPCLFPNLVDIPPVDLSTTIGIAGSAAPFNLGTFNMPSVDLPTLGADNPVVQKTSTPHYKVLTPTKTSTYSTANTVQYIPAHQLGMEVMGMIPNTRISVFFDGINVTTQCAPAIPLDEGFHNGEHDIDFSLTGKKGDAIYTSANGSAVAVFYVPSGTYTTTPKNIAFFNYVNDSETYEQRVANNTCAAYTTYESSHFSAEDNDDIVVFATCPPVSRTPANTGSGRQGGGTGTPQGNTVTSYTVEPMCQSFYVGSDMSQGQDGVYLSSVDLYFSAKSNTQPVSVEIRTTDTNGPTKKVLPYSTVTLPSSSVVVAPSASSNSTYKTKFNFPKPVFLKAGYTYAVAVNPGGQSPDYSLWSATVGKKTTSNGAVTSNWGRGMLYTSTTNGTTWKPVQNQFLKFAVNRIQHDSNYLTNATAVIVNSDYEFLSFINHSKIAFQVGEYVYQKPTAHVAICSTNTTSNTITVNSTAYGSLTTINPAPLSDFAVNDHIVICGSFPATDTDDLGRFNHNLFGNAVTLKVLSVAANGLSLTFGYANGAAITGAPWANGAHHIYKAQPGHVSYDPSTRTVTGTGTRFDVLQNANERDQTDKRPLIIHTANATHTRHEVLWPNNVTNATSITLKSVPKFAIPANSMAIPISAPAGKVVKIDYGRNLIILEKSTANNFTGANSAANVYASPSFFAPGRVLVGTESGATAIIGGVHDMVISSCQPVLHTMAPQGTAITYSANMTTSNYSQVSYPNYKPDSTNYFTNNQIIVASRTNEVVKMANNKSVQITATMTSNSTALSPLIDIVPGSGLIIKSNIINSSAVGENKNKGLAKSKSISKIVTLGEGNDAEDINVYLTAYKPLGTNLIVYAKILDSADPEKFEDKDWSILEQVGGVGLYSDVTNQNDYKEYQYSFPTNPVTIPSFELLTTNNSANIVSTNSDTVWQSVFSNGQLVTLYSDVYGTNFEVNQIANVNSNTSITLANPVTLANTSSAIIASMPFPYSAFKNGNNGNIVRYYSADGSPHDSYKRFAIKIVFTSQQDYLVPKVFDMRVLALSV